VYDIFLVSIISILERLKITVQLKTSCYFSKRSC